MADVLGNICFLCKNSIGSTGRIKVYGKSNVDIKYLIHCAVKVDLSVHPNKEELVICSPKCYRRLVKFERVLRKVDRIRGEIERDFQSGCPGGVKRMAEEPGRPPEADKTIKSTDKNSSSVQKCTSQSQDKATVSATNVNSSPAITTRPTEVCVTVYTKPIAVLPTHSSIPTNQNGLNQTPTFGGINAGQALTSMPPNPGTVQKQDLNAGQTGCLNQTPAFEGINAGQVLTSTLLNPGTAQKQSINAGQTSCLNQTPTFKDINARQVLTSTLLNPGTVQKQSINAGHTSCLNQTPTFGGINAGQVLTSTLLNPGTVQKQGINAGHTSCLNQTPTFGGINAGQVLTSMLLKPGTVQKQGANANQTSCLNQTPAFGGINAGQVLTSMHPKPGTVQTQDVNAGQTGCLNQTPTFIRSLNAAQGLTSMLPKPGTVQTQGVNADQTGCLNQTSTFIRSLNAAQGLTSMLPKPGTVQKQGVNVGQTGFLNFIPVPKPVFVQNQGLNAGQQILTSVLPNDFGSVQVQNNLRPIPETRPLETEVHLTVKYPSKTKHKELKNDFAILGKAIAAGCYNRIAGAVIKNGTLKELIIEKVLKLLNLQVNELCSLKHPSLLRANRNEDGEVEHFDFEKLCLEWKERAPIFYSFLLTCAVIKKDKAPEWLPGVAIAGSVLLKQRNRHMNTGFAPLLKILLNSRSLELASIPGLEEVTVSTSGPDQPGGTAPASATGPAPPPAPDASQSTAEGPPAPPTEQSAPEPEKPTMTVSKDPRYAKYFQMVKVGVPIQAIAPKMMAEGLEPSLLENPDAPAPEGGPASAAQDDSDGDMSSTSSFSDDE